MKKTFVLRPHALLSSRNILLKFGNDNEIAIPIAVIDEIKGKKYESIEKSKIAKDFLDYINSFDIKDLEKEEDKDDTPVSIEEIGKQEDSELSDDESDYENVEFGEDEEFEDEFNEDDDLDYEEEYGLDEFQDDAYERGEE